MTKLTFNDLGLKEGLLKAIDDLGFTTHLKSKQKLFQ